MIRARKWHNPVVYLKNLICTSGLSGHHATEYHNAHFNYDPEEHAHSDTYDDTFSMLRQWVEEDIEYQKLICHATHGDAVSHAFIIPNYFGMGGVCIHYRGQRKGNAYLTVTFPQIDASRVDVDVEIFSHLACHLGRLLEAAETTVHFSICLAFLRWEDMEEEKLLYAEVDSD
jgi:hypothetical protein